MTRSIDSDSFLAMQLRLEVALAQLDQLLIERAMLKAQIVSTEKAARRATRFAFIDELTGLANRRLLGDRFRHASDSRGHDGNMGLMFVDVDGLKHINDMHGHEAGDGLLRHVADSLRTCVRYSDTICRYGGDEFVVLMPQIIDRNCVVATAQRLRDRLGALDSLAAHAIELSVSIGISVYPLDSSELRGLIASADVAMYREKNRKRSDLDMPAAELAPVRKDMPRLSNSSVIG